MLRSPHALSMIFVAALLRIRAADETDGNTEPLGIRGSGLPVLPRASGFRALLASRAHRRREGDPRCRSTTERWLMSQFEISDPGSMRNGTLDLCLGTLREEMRRQNRDEEEREYSQEVGS